MTDFSCESVARAGIGHPLSRIGKELLWRCPFHSPDRHPSFQVNTEKDCWMCGPCGKGGNSWQLAAALAGKEVDDKPGVLDWLREKGITMDREAAGSIVAEYSYTDEIGQLLFQVCRYEPKTFKQRRPDSKGGWIWNLNGTRRVLYRLPEVLKAQSILIVEGERDVETARKLDLTATCNPHGAGKWRTEYGESLRGKRVAIIADADAPGLAHGREATKSLVGVAASLKLIEALPQAKDLTEWIEKGATREALTSLIREAPEVTAADVSRWTQPKAANGFSLTSLGDLLAKPDMPVDYILDGCLVAGTVSGVFAKPKVGKGTLARNLCLAISRGDPFIGLKTKQGECIYLALEEREADLKRDFRAMGADGTEPILIHAAAAPAEGIRALCDLVRERKPRLVVIDPIIRIARIKDEKAYAETYAALGPLIDAARETGTHVMLLHHSGKSVKADAIDSPLGSTAIAGAVASLIVLKRTEQYRTVQTVQRIGEEMPETVLQFDTETKRLSVGGTREEAETETLTGEILEFLLAAEEPKTEPDVTEAVEGKTKFARRALRQLVEQGKVSREGAGKRGDPYRYHFSFSCSQYIAGTREQETQKVDDTRIKTEGNLVPASEQKSFLVPEGDQPDFDEKEGPENGPDAIDF